jgi:hypothetical protein
MGFGAQTFEIRKGRSGKDETDLDEEAAPLGPIALPQSITSAEGEEHLRKKFGVEQLPDMGDRHENVRLTQSAGVGGPIRSPRNMLIMALVLLLIGGGVLLYFANANGSLDKILQGQ